MNKMLISLAVGPEYEEMFEVTRPAMQRYARAHGYTSAVPNHEVFVDTERHPSYWKIEAILRCFLAGIDIVLWLDADVEILNFDRDIAQDLGRENLFGCVVHRTKTHGTIPNAGVWVVRKEFAPWLLKMNRLDRFASSPHVWEQAALVSIMGGNHDQYPITLPETKPLPWAELPYEWNVIDQDERGVPEMTRFFHSVRGTDNRIERLR